MDIDLNTALSHPLWRSNKRGVTTYTMDGQKDRWLIIYYPIFQNGKTQGYYSEPRALVQNIDKEGFWHKEVPLRYLNN